MPSCCNGSQPEVQSLLPIHLNGNLFNDLSVPWGMKMVIKR